MFGGTGVESCTGTAFVRRFSLMPAAVVGSGSAVAVAPAAVGSTGETAGLDAGV